MRLLTRARWGATLGLGPAMNLPARGLHVHHSVTLADDDHNLLATGDVAADMREIERIGKERFGRFPYSYCIHPSGWVGEGADLTIGAHTAGFNSTSFGVCFIGNYQTDRLTDAQVSAFRELRHGLVEHGELIRVHYVVPHRSRKATACPGANTMVRWSDLMTPWVPASAPTPTPTPGPNPMPKGTCDVQLPVLEEGESGGSVRSLQALLNTKAGQGLRVDGEFGVRTEQAVFNVQRFFGLKVDGVVGTKTWGALFV